MSEASELLWSYSIISSHSISKSSNKYSVHLKILSVFRNQSSRLFDLNSLSLSLILKALDLVTPSLLIDFITRTCQVRI